MTVEDRFWNLVRKTDGCWEWIGGTARGYGKFRLEGRRTISAHRFSYMINVGQLKPRQVVRHSCDNRRCVRPSHLISGSQLQNVHDMIKRGRMPRGSTRAGAKLDEAKVASIRDGLGMGVKAPELAAKFGVSVTTIYHIAHRKKWAHV